MGRSLGATSRVPPSPPSDWRDCAKYRRSLIDLLATIVAGAAARSHSWQAGCEPERHLDTLRPTTDRTGGRVAPFDVVVDYCNRPESATPVNNYARPGLETLLRQLLCRRLVPGRRPRPYWDQAASYWGAHYFEQSAIRAEWHTDPLALDRLVALLGGRMREDWFADTFLPAGWLSTRSGSASAAQKPSSSCSARACRTFRPLRREPSRVGLREAAGRGTRFRRPGALLRRRHPIGRLADGSLQPGDLYGLFAPHHGA